MQITHVSAELAPVAKVGGLADVLHGLARALLNLDHQVTLILPKYSTLDSSGIENFFSTSEKLHLNFNHQHHTLNLWQGQVDGIPVIFIDSEKYFGRECVYGFDDDVERFSFFCVAALAYLKAHPCDALHLHDWHTALLAGLVKELAPQCAPKVIFTIHNLAYQGHCHKADVEKTGWLSDHLKIHNDYNLMKCGIVFADQVTTVSPTYAEEILSKHLGGELQKTLKHYEAKFSGVLNGLDSEYWNPETDPLLPFHYTSNSIEHKKKIKEKLQRKLGLKITTAPLVGSVTRLVHQKGPELIKAALLRTLEWQGQFVLLGSASDPTTKRHFSNLKYALEECGHVHIELSYDEELSHLLYAASDLFVIPSLFEPCGLTQLIAMRYGTLPLARETGGLMDTVFDSQNGFMFREATAEGVNQALDRAFDVWYERPELWQALIQNAMSEDHSWQEPAAEYLSLYYS